MVEFTYKAIWSWALLCWRFLFANLFIIFFMFISLFCERETTHARQQGRGREREREWGRIPSRLHALSTEPDVMFDLRNHIMTGSKIKSHTLNRVCEFNLFVIRLLRLSISSWFSLGKLFLGIYLSLLVSLVCWCVIIHNSPF